MNLEDEEAAMVSAVASGATLAAAPLPLDEPLLNVGPLLDKVRPLELLSTKSTHAHVCLEAPSVVLIVTVPHA